MILNTACHGRITIFALVSILILTYIVFSPSLDNDFVNWDDPAYIQSNESIKSLSWPQTGKIFSSFVNGNYQPLSVLSFAVDYHFAKLDPRVYHQTNLILHLLNTLLVYCLMLFLTHQPVTALLCSLFFGIHPMRVESVAWITERKDVLFSFFYLGSLISYLSYRAKSTTRPHYLIFFFILFILSLFSKPAAVSLPLVLLLLDYYQGQRLDKTIILEKIPFLLLSFLFGLLAVYGGFTPLSDHYPIMKSLSLGIPGLDAHHQNLFSLPECFLLISHALLVYITKLIWVVGLSCYYPLPIRAENMLPLIYYLSPLILLLVLALIIVKFRQNRTLIFGLAFFLSTIVFNLPFSESGHSNLFADRFTYIPYIGFFLIVASIINRQINDQNRYLPVLVIVMISATLFFSFQTWRRCKVWENSGTLWSDVIKKYPRTLVAYYNRGNYFLDTEQFDLAIKDYNIVLTLDPKHYRTNKNRQLAYHLKRRLEKS